MAPYREDWQQTFTRSGWRDELEVYYRERKSVWFVLALMIAMGAFWTSPWAWVGFFCILATYSAFAMVRIGVVVGVSFAAWFVIGIEAAHLPQFLWPNGTFYRAYGLWCIATLFLLVVWKADGVHKLRDRLGADADAD